MKDIDMEKKIAGKSRKMWNSRVEEIFNKKVKTWEGARNGRNTLQSKYLWKKLSHVSTMLMIMRMMKQYFLFSDFLSSCCQSMSLS